MNPTKNQDTALPAVSLGTTWQGLSLDSRQAHPLHQEDSVWSQTNCYADVWISFLSGLGADPRPALASAVAADCLVGQWEFYKPDHRDLEELYGIRVGEIDIWRGLELQVWEALASGNTIAFEGDAYWLPDTAGVSYGTGHTKSTVIPVALDPERKSMDYLHNNGLFRLEGTDYEHILGEARAEGIVPAPYTELIRLDGFRNGQGTLAQGASPQEEAARLLAHHARRRPVTDPMERFTAIVLELEQELIRRATSGEEAEAVQAYFHTASFEITRQCGVAALLAGYAAELLSQEAHQAFYAVAGLAKRLQFKLARAAHGRSARTETILAELVREWGRGQQELTAALAKDPDGRH